MYDIKIEYDKNGFVKKGKFISTDYIVLNKRNGETFFHKNILEDLEPKLKQKFIEVFGDEELNNKKDINIKIFGQICNLSGISLGVTVNGVCLNIPKSN